MKDALESRGWGVALVLGVALFVMGFWFGRSTTPTVADAGVSRDISQDVSQEDGYRESPREVLRGGNDAIEGDGDTVERVGADVSSLRSRLARLSQERASASRDEEMQALLRQLAEDDPRGALTLAEDQINLKSRHQFQLAALEGWGARDPAAAWQWIQDWPARRREEGFARIAEGAAAADPEGLANLGRKAITQGSLSRARGFALVKALTRHGAFEQAVALTRHESVDTATAAAWTTAAYQSWAEYQPDEAASHALRSDGASQANSAFNAVVMGWAQTEPASLAEFAQQLPEGRERTYALGEALRQWVEREPLAAADWLDRVEPSPELDVGVLALANNPYLGENRPEIAVSWAESLYDTQLRAETLSRIVRQWAASDRKSAYRYVQTSGALPTATREELLALLEGR